MGGAAVADLAVATPEQIADAWAVGVMYSTPEHARSERYRHPYPDDLDDPTYHRDDWAKNGGWHRARDISNPSAMQTIRSHLARKGLRVPDGVEATWAWTVERQKRRATVEHQVAEALDLAEADGVDRSDHDLAVAVREHLKRWIEIS